MSIQDNLKRIDPTKIKSPTGRTYGEELKIAANRLSDCIQYRIDEFYNSYNPLVYQRTYGMYRSLTVEDIASIKVTGNTLSISLHFNENANHNSWTGEQVNTAYLMNYGYQTPDKPSTLPFYREGFYFVEKGIEDFNKSNPLKIKVAVCLPDSYYV